MVGNGVERSKFVSRFPVTSSPKGSFFAECRASHLVSAATKAVGNLAHRIKVNTTLAFMRDNPNILQSLPFPIEIRDRHNRKIRRNCIIGALFALDEFDLIETKPEANSSSLIPTIFSWFNKVDTRSSHIKRQLQRQLEEESAPRHELATKNRRANSLKEIEELIKKVIECTDISNDSIKSFPDLLNQKFIHDFITTAFSPDENDNGEEGIVWDFWQLNLDYLDLLETYVSNVNVENKSRPHLGGRLSQKTLAVDAAVSLAFLRCSQFCHLEVSAKGIDKKFIVKPTIRFDCSKALPNILTGIGQTLSFDIYGAKYSPIYQVPLRLGSNHRDALISLCQTKASELRSLCGHVPTQSIDYSK